MFIGDIKKLAKENTNFRKVIYTGDLSQLVLMNIPVGEEIGEEVHRGIDQIIFLVDGEGEAALDGQNYPLDEHGVVFVPAGTRHNIKNVGNEPLKIYTVYSPPAHADGTVHQTKAEALAGEESEKAAVSPHDLYENI